MNPVKTHSPMDTDVRRDRAFASVLSDMIVNRDAQVFVVSPDRDSSVRWFREFTRFVERFAAFHSKDVGQRQAFRAQFSFAQMGLYARAASTDSVAWFKTPGEIERSSARGREHPRRWDHFLDRWSPSLGTDTAALATSAGIAGRPGEKLSKGLDAGKHPPAGPSPVGTVSWVREGSGQGPLGQDSDQVSRKRGDAGN